MIYEINFLVLQSKTAELEKIRKSTKKFIESFGAKVVEEKEYLKRKLAYEIQHENYGFFTVLRFEFEGKTNLDELKAKLNQKTEVARYIIVQAEDLPSLEEQDAKAQEKIQTDRKSIKSEDVEKALKEQKRAETVEKKEKPAPAETKPEKEEEKPEVKKENLSAEEVEAPEKPKKKPVPKKEEAKKPAKEENLSAEEVEAPAEKKPEKKEEKPAKKETPKDKEDKKSEDQDKKEKVSLDELDKKLDEILNS